MWLCMLAKGCKFIFMSSFFFFSSCNSEAYMFVMLSCLHPAVYESPTQAWLTPCFIIYLHSFECNENASCPKTARPRLLKSVGFDLNHLVNCRTAMNLLWWTGEPLLRTVFSQADDVHVVLCALSFKNCGFLVCKQLFSEKQCSVKLNWTSVIMKHWNNLLPGVDQSDHTIGLKMPLPYFFISTLAILFK